MRVELETIYVHPLDGEAGSRPLSNPFPPETSIILECLNWPGKNGSIKKKRKEKKKL